MIKRKTFFFHFGTTFSTPWLQKKKFDFYWTTTLTTLRSWWEKCSFFILLGRSLWKYLLTWSYIAHGITNLSKKFPNGILPGKSMWNLKNFLSQEFQWSLTWFTFLFSALQKGHNTISCLEWDFTWYQTNWRSTHWKKNIRLF